MISVLCVNRPTFYEGIPGLDLWDKERDAYNFAGSNAVITHAPCAQWSQLRGLSNPDQKQKDLAWHCLEKVKNNGGIFEHPRNSSFFKQAGVKPSFCVDQAWWDFPARKATWLYFNGCKPIAYPIKFDLVERVEDLWSTERSRMTLTFAQWLVDCIKASGLEPDIKTVNRE